MPYRDISSLPAAVKDNLPAAAAKIWMSAHNAALKQYKGDESKAAAVAWAAVKRKWAKDREGEWHLKKSMTDVEIRADVVKVDKATRLVWGWGSVADVDGLPVLDSQGDIIDPDDLQAAVHDYVKSLRHAKVMHKGDPVGQVVDSFVWTEDLQKAFGVNFGKVGWALGIEMPASVVERYESGELTMLSIAGSAARVEASDGE